jgi:hypothetical protein
LVAPAHIHIIYITGGGGVKKNVEAFIFGPMGAVFENGGKFKHSRYGDLPAVRLVDLELRYRNARQQPMVKKFPRVVL